MAEFTKGSEKVYDKEKYREMLLEAAETVLGYFGLDRTLFGGTSRNHPNLYQKVIVERYWRTQRILPYRQGILKKYPNGYLGDGPGDCPAMNQTG